MCRHKDMFVNVVCDTQHADRAQRSPHLEAIGGGGVPVGADADESDLREDRHQDAVEWQVGQHVGLPQAAAVAGPGRRPWTPWQFALLTRARVACEQQVSQVVRLHRL